MYRLDQLEQQFFRLCERIFFPERRQEAYDHSLCVSKMAMLLAHQRHLDPELAGIIGLYHDIHTYLTGDSQNHATKSAQKAAEIFQQAHLFTTEEIQLMTCAIRHHSDKEHIHDAYDELLKDADVLAHMLENKELKVSQKEKTRQARLLSWINA